ncbi:MAG TPA: hypothetical protein VGE41_10540 [Verrucomicrobiae bacterium]|jgi:hypothetical protein
MSRSFRRRGGFDKGYQSWMGTSFLALTPEVSGQAAFDQLGLTLTTFDGGLTTDFDGNKPGPDIIYTPIGCKGRKPRKDP